MIDLCRPALLVPAMTLTAVLGCASGSKPVDPEALQARIAASENQYRELSRTTIADENRATKYIQLLDDRDELIAQQAKTASEYAQALKSLNRDYDATRADFESLMLAYNSERRIGHSRYIDLMSQMKSTTTSREWSKLSKFELKELNPQALVYAESGGR